VSRASARSYAAGRASTRAPTSACARTRASRSPCAASSRGRSTEMGTLELLHPAWLGLLGLLAPLVVFYILKVKRQRRRVASTWLWREARRDLMARSPFKRLVVQLPLILQALALIALAVAAAKP